MQEIDWIEIKDSYELQLIDCNCNNCIFMVRDKEETNKWLDFRERVQLDEFTKKKAKAISDAENVEDEAQRKGDLRVSNKMRFQFEKAGMISYGDCSKLKKKISFIPVHCQPENQECFKHRRL